MSAPQSRQPAAPGRIRLRVVLDSGYALGPGKADLLEGIHETGSIAAAGRRMRMSYKRAWQLVDGLNSGFAGPLVVAHRGGRGHGGAELTDLGCEVLETYRRMEEQAGKAVAADLRRLGRRAAGPDG